MAAAFIVVMIGLFFAVPLAGRRVFYYGDLANYFLPYYDYFFSQLRQGVWAQWCPLDGTGVSLLANPQTGAFNPLNVVFLLLPAAHAMSVSIVLHFAIAAVGMTVLVRGLRLGWFAALIGAMAFAFSGTMLSLSNTIDYFQAAAWIPLFLHFVLACAGDGPTSRRLAGGAAAYGMVLLGSPEYALVCAAVAAALAAAATLCAWRKRHAGYWRPIASVALLGVLGALLAAVQWVPMLITLPYTAHHDALTLKEATRVALQPVALWNQLVPHLLYRFDGVTVAAREGLFAGSRPSWLLDIYPGIFALFFALVGLWRGPWRHRVLWGSMMVVALLLAMSNRLPFYRWLYELLPPFRHFRYTEKFMLLYTLGLAMLAALGAHHLLAERSRARRAIWLTALLVVPLLAVSLWQAISLRSFAVTVSRHVFGLNPAAYGGSALHTIAGHLNDLIVAWRNSTLLVASLAAASWLALKGRPRPRLAAGLVLVIAAVDLLSANRALAPVFDRALFDRPPMVRRWQGESDPPARFQQLDDWQVHRLPPWPLEVSAPSRVWLHRDEAVPNYGLPFGMVAAHATSVLMFAGQDQLYDRLKTLPPADQLPVLRLLNVQLLLATADMSIPGLIPRGYSRTLYYRAYEDRLAYPRAFVVSAAAMADTPEAALTMVIERQVDAATTVVWDRQDAGTATLPAGGGRGKADFTAYEPNRVALRVHADGPAVLVLSDAFAPGWSVTIDGRPAPVRRAYGLLRSTPVEAGEHQVEFRYWQPGFGWGLALSATGLFALCAMAWIGRRQGRIVAVGEVK